MTVQQHARKGQLGGEQSVFGSGFNKPRTNLRALLDESPQFIAGYGAQFVSGFRTRENHLNSNPDLEGALTAAVYAGDKQGDTQLHDGGPFGPRSLTQSTVPADIAKKKT
ncbi:hypothetical protein IZ6_08020 [Terrihabitans soli]|uniref:Uncharacterized protein n=1 Tax=Terrihabitans soli TaxID=708113 RepID=A0A6S6QQ36_9HYPH|nr:hypothetical protein IZ6_08020 [Terrihabitans soli]